MTTLDTLRSDWELDLVALVCDYCDWNYLSVDGSTRLCPHCSQGKLQQFETDAEHFIRLAPPELILQYRIGREGMKKLIGQFTMGIPFPPSDLNADALLERAQKVFLPQWLVDGNVQAQWRAEVGFQYQVESHKSSYQRGQWHTQKVYETKLEWEKRVGQLERDYDNINAPALDEHGQLMRQLGRYDIALAEKYSNEALRQALIRLPNRSTDDAFGDAKEQFRIRASEDIKTATESENVRDFRWKARYANLNWTQMLLPVYMTYYQDDEGKRRVVFVNGSSGQASGERRGSMKRAQQMTMRGLFITALIIAIAIVIAILNPLWDDIAAILAIIGTIIGIGSIIPVVQVWRFNSQQDR